MIVEKLLKHRDADIPTSSMADIAFLLLTFFLVTTSLDLDKGLQLRLPPIGTDIPIPPSMIASLLINEQGQVMLDNQESPMTAIRDRLNNRLSRQPELIVSIKSDRNVPYSQYVSVLDQVQLTECYRISIADPDN